MRPDSLESTQPDRPSHASPPGARAIVALGKQPFVWLGLAQLAALTFGISIFPWIAKWLFRPQVKALGPWYLLLALACIPFMAWQARRWLRHPAIALATLVLLGFLLQQGFAWSEGRGLEGMRDRITKTGHAEFARVAVQQDSMWSVLREYESKLKSNELGGYAPSKPPGQLLFYMATERLARRFAVGDDSFARLDSLQWFAAITWPLLAYTVLVPLYFVLRRIVDADIAYLACVVYLVIPSVTLITLHTDQCLYPLLFMSTIWLCVVAQSRRSWVWSIAAGAACYLSAMFSFALLLAAPLMIAFAAAVEVESHPVSDSRALYLAVWRTAAGALLGFGLLYLLFQSVFHYDYFSGLLGAMQHHAKWKYWRGTMSELLYYAWLGGFEFAIWIGIPAAVLAATNAGRACLRLKRGIAGGLALPAMALTTVFVFLALFGRAKGETGRLWLLLVPVCCALVAAELNRQKNATRVLFVGAFLGLQWLIVFLTKARLDFW